MAAILFTLPSWGVLSEYNLDRTLISLELDMKVLQQNMQKDIQRFENRQIEFRNGIEQLDETCDETGIMLYSQDERYLYGTLLAIQGMKDVIGRIRSQKGKLSQLETDLSVITHRYGELSDFLKQLESRSLTPAVRDVLRNSINIADSLRQSVDSCLASVAADKMKYNGLLRKADRLEAYNNAVMERVQASVFVEGNETFGEILSHFPTRLVEFKDDVVWRFLTGQSDMDDWQADESRMYGYIDISNYIALGLALCFYLFARFTRFFPGYVAKKRIYWALSLWLLLRIVGCFVIWLFVELPPMLRVSLILESEICLLAFLILISTTIRNKKGKIGRSLVSYLPMFSMTYMFVQYQDGLVPVTTVTFTSPFLFILAFIGQMLICVFNRKKLDTADRRMMWTNFVVIGVCAITAFSGYTILASMLMLLWSGIVAGILFFELIKEFIAKKNLTKNSIAGITLKTLVYPLAIPVILLVAAYWVTHLYNLISWFYDRLNTPFVDMPDKVGVVSFAKILYIYGLGVLVNYGSTLVKAILWRDVSNRQGRMAVAISIGNIIVWLCYVIAVILILDINKAGLVAAVGGASVGIGFALKDTFENFFSGLSLMTGRLRPGDIMEYDGVRGKVLDIGIISTRMETEDGPIMTMTNRLLFEKNFKNMTRNHRVELRHITFDISADNDPKSVRNIILDSFRGIDGVDDSRRHVVIMRNFGSGVMRVELKVWIDSEKYLATEPAVREAVYEAFKQHHIQAASFIQQIDSKGTHSIMTNQRTIL